MSTPYTKVAIACQGGGSHCGYTSGVLAALMRRTQAREGRLVIDDRYELVGLSGTSGGAIGAYLAWTDLLRMREPGYRPPARFAVERFWEGMKAQPFPWPPNFPSTDLYSNWLQLAVSQLDGVLPLVSPSPNFVTAIAQQQLGRAIQAAADLSPAEQALARPPWMREQMASAGPADFPMLMVGAANIDDTDFAPFVNTPGNRPNIDQLLASAALPEFYPAVEVDAALSPAAQRKRGAACDAREAAAPARYWDGLLSQNPPLSDFLSAPRRYRPQEIWIVRINPALQVREGPVARRRPDLLPDEIRDRRNELAGNLSLEQEKRSIRTINKLLRKHRKPLLASYQEVGLWGMALDGPWDLPDSEDKPDGDWLPAPVPLPRQLQDLDATSKLKRFAPFIDALVDHGERCAVEFLARKRAAAGSRGTGQPESIAA